MSSQADRGLEVLASREPRPRTGEQENSLGWGNLLLVGFVSSVAAGLFVATLNIRPPR